ncbi:hypothetical protein [Pseudoflavonifractor sp. 524-17]|uniref:hypothetical protein n=1 Tax=Pseudoflavonifractor sp. 524-17 TaxID=2304577 RepID=UPI00137B7C33|nr:hypothetical protein [Pseudoflavonifractor sp. 524-17]
MIINPRVLIEKNYIAAAQANDLEVVERVFNEEARKISSILLKFGSNSLSRADFCLNIALKELGIPCSPEQMITLIKRSNTPKRYKERSSYDYKLGRKISDKNSFYLESKSVNINYYWKYPQQENEAHPNFLFRESSRNVIRFEVQYKSPNLYPLVQGIRGDSKFFISIDGHSIEDVYQASVLEQVHNPSIPVDII